MCSYVSSISLLPPYELMSAAGAVRTLSSHTVDLVDCIAEEMNIDDLKEYIQIHQPDIILNLIGLESFENDIQHIDELKLQFPKIIQVGFGHYPSHFPHPIMENSAIDILIKGEPDTTIISIMDCISQGIDLNQTKNIIYKNSQGAIILTPVSNRLTDLDALGMPAHDLVNPRHYFEVFMPEPFSMIQTSRGCPFSCTYCITTFGKKYTVRSVDSILKEIIWLRKNHHIKSFRIIDDTFTIRRAHVIDLCKKLIEESIHLTWSCLSRADTIDEEMIRWMHDAGCQKIYFGIESGSQSTLDFYKKGIKKEKVKETLDLCNKYGVESGGMFIVGLPGEDEEQIEETIQFIKELNFTYIGCNELTPYPGTELYEQLKDEVDFSLFPYRLKFKDPEISRLALKRISYIHKEFYRDRKTLTHLVSFSIRHFRVFLNTVRRISLSKRSMKDNKKNMTINLRDILK